MAKQFVPGSYKAVISGSRIATIHIDEDMRYEYKEDSPRNGVIQQVATKGRLIFSSWRKARAGRVKLEWVSTSSIKVESPYSSTIGHGNNEGNVAFSSGPFITGMPLHVFYMSKLDSASSE